MHFNLGAANNIADEQPLNPDYGLASEHTQVVCFNLIREWIDLQFNVDSERHGFKAAFHGNFIFIFSFLCLTWNLNMSLTSNEPTHYLLDYSDIKLQKFPHSKTFNWTHLFRQSKSIWWGKKGKLFLQFLYYSYSNATKWNVLGQPDFICTPCLIHNTNLHTQNYQDGWGVTL